MNIDLNFDPTEEDKRNFQKFIKTTDYYDPKCEYKYGSIVKKVNSESGDGHPNGSIGRLVKGVVFGHFELYGVVWELSEPLIVIVQKHKIQKIR